MGWIAQVLSAAKETINGAKARIIKSDTGGGFNLLSEQFGPVGDDSQPLPGDYVVLMPIRGEGRAVVVGYLDPQNDQKVGSGERRVYARDSNGASVVELWLKADGSAVLDNGSGSIELQPSGVCSINGLTIDVNGNLQTPGTVEAFDGNFGGIDFSTHTHQQGNDSDGDVEQDTGVPI